MLLTGVADVTANVVVVGFIQRPLHAAFRNLGFSVREEAEKHQRQGHGHPPRGPPTSPVTKDVAADGPIQSQRDPRKSI